MDMKLFLRYQISGSVFIAWFLLFHYSVHSADFADMAKQIMDVSSLATFAIALPLGAIIHQFSVTIKNQFFGLCEDSYLSDSPMKNPTKAMLKFYKNKINKDPEVKEISIEYFTYIKDKITNLNSFYYMRFDNGFLAPLLAVILFYIIDYQHITWLVAFLPCFLCIFLIILQCIYPEIKMRFKIICLILIVIILFAPFIIKYCSLSKTYQSNIELTTQSIKVESNIRYIITNQYSFESSGNVVQESQNIANALTNDNSLSVIVESDNLQKISIIESKEHTTNNQTVTCTSKCLKCAEESPCTICNISESLESVPTHISEVEITKIDTSLLNKVLIACLFASFLLLSYIPRIIQEIKEYTDILSPPPNEKTAKSSCWLCRLCCFLSIICCFIYWIKVLEDRNR